MISLLPQILPKQNTDFVHFLCTNILNCPLNLHRKKKKKKKKPYLAKTLTEPIDVIVALLSTPNLNANFACNKRQLLTALWSNVKQASSEWQYSSPMMLGGPVGAAIIFQGVRATTLFKCSGSTYGHWRSSSWWRSRRPPSLPMPRQVLWPSYPDPSQNIKWRLMIGN